MNFFYQKARDIRKEKKIRIDAVASQLGISRATLWLWETGKSNPSERMIRLLAKILNIPVELISDLKAEALTSENVELSRINSLLYSFGNTNIIERRNHQAHYLTGIQRLFDELNQVSAVTATFVNTIQMVCYVKDLSLKYVLVNNAFLDNLSLSRQYKSLGKTDQDFFSREEAKQNAEEDERVIVRGIAESNEGFIPGSRKRKWGIISRIPIMDFQGKVTGVLVYINDTTERRELELTQNAMIECIASVAEYKTHESAMHIRRTQRFLKELAFSLRTKPGYEEILNDKKINSLAQAAPLHDIGEIVVPDVILLKKGKLTDEEYETIKKHPLIGSQTIVRYEKSLPNNILLKYAEEIALSHHEKWDGSGYPKGLKGEKIPLSGRLMALADVYDALTSDSVYRTARTHKEAVTIIESEKEKHFDPEIVDAFLTVQDKFETIAKELADPKKTIDLIRT
ncbi:MAG TPA: hypothetical protein DD381_12975 [Lentisphaeria bacterium]|nr:MAG: hypothetical protein A2X47_12535 [Lentisphaerae bacterium GWF2_38_69]HBM17235.1 hypothetical protein [Lentisphaeria bacterium]